MRVLAHLLTLLVLSLVACPAPENGDGDGEGEGEGEEPRVYDDIDISFVVDVDGRDATVFVPEAYDGTTALPLVLLLHGYGINGAQMAQFTGFGAIAEANDLLFASPDGTVDADGGNFWNAAGACCDFARSGVDDSAFLRGIIDQARERANVDPARIWVVGHSNGGFMAHRLACDHADVIAAVVSMAGAIDAVACEPSEPVAVLQVHGTADPTILFGGGNVGAGGDNYPGAADTVAQWALTNSCGERSTVDPVNIDLATDLAGAETTVSRFDGCAEGGAAELWSVEGAGHIINGGAAFVTRMLGFLTAHAR